jgi:hypothetical protein
VAIPLTSEHPHPLPSTDGNQLLIVELREAEDAVVEGGMLAAGAGQEGDPGRVLLRSLRLRDRRLRASSELPDV